MTDHLLLVNGRFHQEGDRPVEAVALVGERIVWAGTEAEARDRLPARVELLDLGNRYVAPGLSDCHTHALNYGRSRMGVPCWPSDVGSVTQIVERVRTADREAPPGKWLRGRGYDPARLREGRAPTAEELGLPSGRPVVLDSFDFHRRVANRAALDAAGITAGTPDPPGGEIARDEHGRPSGELIDAARGLIDRAMPPWPREEDDEAVRIAEERWLSMGFTCVTNAAPLTMSRWGEEVEAFLRLRGRQESRIRFRTMIRPEILDAASEVGLLPGFGDDWFRVVGVKAFADGAVGPRTAAVHEPPYTTGGLGRMALTDDEIDALVGRAIEAGWRLCVHAIGDRAVETVALAFSRHAGEGRRLRHRIEHCQMSTDAATTAMVEGGVTPVPQMAFLRQRGAAFADALGEERTSRMYPLRSWIDAGLRPVHSSDAPVIPDPRPMPALATAVTRIDEAGNVFGADQATTVAEGLSMMTTWAARADGEEEARGRIAAGYLADFTVLDEDPGDVAPVDIAEIPVAATIVGGKVRWSTADF